LVLNFLELSSRGEEDFEGKEGTLAREFSKLLSFYKRSQAVKTLKNGAINFCNKKNIFSFYKLIK